MGGEPWCFPPHVIADMTDYQILHVYLLPAVSRARRDAGEAPPVAVSVADLEAMGLSAETARRMAADLTGG